MKHVSLVAILVATALLRLDSATDALSDVRAALGGDAVLSRITSIHAVGKIEQYAGTRDGTIEVYYREPDRFARVTRTALNPSGAYSGVTDRNGREVDRRPLAERDVEFGALGAPDLTTDSTVTTSRTVFAGRTATVGGFRQYAAFVIPLLARLSSSFPAKVGVSSDVVRFDGDDGERWTLALDPATRLPATLTRSATIGADTVITFSDYAKVDGATWPFHIVTRTGDRLFEQITIKKYEINKPIDDKVFR